MQKENRSEKFCNTKNVVLERIKFERMIELLEREIK